MLISRRKICLIKPIILQISLIVNKINSLLIILLRLVYIFLNINLKNNQLYLSLLLGHMNSAPVEVGILVDRFRLLFLFTVIIISFAVFRFRYSYIRHYKFYIRFHILLFIFVCSILILIISSNLLFTIIGWDGLGVSSYLLVIYYGSRKSYNAGILTVLSNRLGDALILFRMGFIFHMGSWNMNFYKELLNVNWTFAFLLIVGSFTKRAQIPFRAWLPAAIAAPTPVSSLVHSSTLVTAGVYLLFRHLNEIGSYSQLKVILVIGIATIIIASLSALNEKDIKKIVALSTLSQLGLIMTSLGLKWIFISFFHLVIHAFFKAIMFIGVGNLIHFSQFYQSIKNRGGILFSSPFNSATLILSRFRLCGVPFAAAFFSKEPIIEWSVYTGSSLGLHLCMLLRIFITILYRSRLIKVVVLNYRGIHPKLMLNESDIFLRKGVIVLSVPSFTRGSILGSILHICPKRFFYTRTIKFIIFFSFFLFFFIFSKRWYPLKLKGSVYFYSIWSLTLFSRSFFNKLEKILSWAINRVTFRYNLNYLSTSLLLFSPLRRSIFRTNFLYRTIISIPRFLILFFLFK